MPERFLGATSTIRCTEENTMQLTAELRWFYRGTLPEETLQWFQQEQLGKYVAPEEREDVYLYLPECEYMGIKLRQERLEVKWRKAELGVVGFGDQVEGKAEKWGKWLCEDPSAESFQLAGVVGKLWVSVKKVRAQRLYENCAVELTQLNVGDNDWWSLAFEAVGDDVSLVDNLQTVASSVFKSHHYPKLQVEDSYGYPSWLSIVS